MIETSNNIKMKPPSWLSFVKECRAIIDIASTPFSLVGAAFSQKQSDGCLPILMFPGFGSDEKYLRLMEIYLRNHGHKTMGWGLGRNLAGLNLKHSLEDLSSRWEIDYPDNFTVDGYRGEASMPFLCDKAIAKVDEISTQLNSPVIIIGWSLGGYIARECARELTDEVAQIITFGAPIFGGPKYTVAAPFYKSKNFDLDWIEKSIEERERKPIKQPITCIYSRSDGVVSQHAAIDTVSPNVRNIAIDAAHLGMGFNHKIWRLVKKALDIEAQRRKQKAI